MWRLGNKSGIRKKGSWAWWCPPVIPALGRQGQVISACKASLVYRMSSRTAKAALERNPVSTPLSPKKGILGEIRKLTRNGQGERERTVEAGITENKV